MYEELIIRHCSPTLAGLKTGSLFTGSYGSAEEVKKSVRDLNRILVPKGLRILPLRYSKDRVLIYLYRPARLKQDLANGAACELLRDSGYSCGKPERCIVQLVKKLRENQDFPHEIGLFLGYPPEDVQGFIENKADCYKCAGCWKVYGDEEKAQKIFCRYKKCTDIYYAQWLKGKTIERLAVAV